MKKDFAMFSLATIRKSWDEHRNEIIEEIDEYNFISKDYYVNDI